MIAKIFLLGFVCVLIQVLYAADTKFYMSHEKVNFHMAYISCLESNMDLATIKSQSNQKNLNHFLKDITYDGDVFWLSGSNLPDTSSQQYYWYSGGNRVTYTNWFTGEPNNSDGVESCLTVAKISGNLGWNDRFCGTEFKYICQYRRNVNENLTLIN